MPKPMNNEHPHNTSPAWPSDEQLRRIRSQSGRYKISLVVTTNDPCIDIRIGDAVRPTINSETEILESVSLPQSLLFTEAMQERAKLESAYADAISALRYIEQQHGRLYGVGWDRVYAAAERLRGGGSDG
jgi:hypothetical protein